MVTAVTMTVARDWLKIDVASSKPIGNIGITEISWLLRLTPDRSNTRFIKRRSAESAHYSKTRKVVADSARPFTQYARRNV
jgi:hypothetical protein